MNNIPIDIKSLHINATKALKEKNYAQGKILLEKILLINPNIFEINFNLAMLNLQLNDVETSIKYFEKAKKLNPDASRVYFNLGLAYEKKKK
tara:strand:+ start:35 stop:310 length:276 start_codon:yes stop_codon:yes gene_type:complete